MRPSGGRIPGRPLIGKWNRPQHTDSQYAGCTFESYAGQPLGEFHHSRAGDEGQARSGRLGSGANLGLSLLFDQDKVQDRFFLVAGGEFERHVAPFERQVVAVQGEIKLTLA